MGVDEIGFFKRLDCVAGYQFQTHRFFQSAIILVIRCFGNWMNRGRTLRVKLKSLQATP